MSDNANNITKSSFEVLDLRSNGTTFFAALVQVGAIALRLNGSFSKKNGNPYMFSGQVWKQDGTGIDRSQVACGYSQELEGGGRIYAATMSAYLWDEIESHIVSLVKANKAKKFPEKKASDDETQKEAVK